MTSPLSGSSPIWGESSTAFDCQINVGSNASTFVVGDDVVNANITVEILVRREDESIVTFSKGANDGVIICIRGETFYDQFIPGICIGKALQEVSLADCIWRTFF